jgi:SAM-dependent methyltransferase
LFKDDIDFVTEAVKKYGKQYPVLDAGGLEKPVVADYFITINGGSQMDRYLNLDKPPFQDLFGEYAIQNPDGTDQPPIEKMTEKDYWGTVVCLSVLEHVNNPFEVFEGLYRILKPGGLLMLSTEFSFPYHPSLSEDGTRVDYPDNFRFSPSGLEVLAKYAKFDILECGWRLNIHAGMGVLDIKSGLPQEIKSVAIVCRKPEIQV